MKSRLAIDILRSDAEKIRQIIIAQSNMFCLAKCKAFEEVIDTQVYGLSCKIDFAVEVNLIDKDEGREILDTLEHEVAKMYETIEKGHNINETNQKES